MNRRNLLRLVAAGPVALLAPVAPVAPKIGPEFYRVMGGPLGGAYLKASDVTAYERGWFSIRRFMVMNEIPRVEQFWFRRGFPASGGVPTLWGDVGAPKVWLQRLQP